MQEMERVIVVEGTRDRKRVLEVLTEAVEVYCTNGTLSWAKMESFIDLLEDKVIYLLFDRDHTGDQLRKAFRREFPDARVLYIDPVYGAVERAAHHHLATLLNSVDFEVHVHYLMANPDHKEKRYERMDSKRTRGPDSNG
ncbi:MAG: hypothetical protein ACRC5C_08765 [Bacilli bacterium]